MAGMIERGNVMDPELAIFLLSELDGMIQSDIMLLGPEEIVSYENQEQELILRKPHDGIYVSFLVAMIRQVQEEFEGYNNAQGIVNEKLETFREWYVAHYDPAETASREYMGAAPGGAGYGFAYLTAYGLAVKHGYSGTEEEWLRSLEGQPGAPGEAARMRFDAGTGMIQWGVGGEWYDLFTIEELKEPVVEELVAQVQALADAAADSEAAAKGHARTAAKAAEDALGSAGRAYASEQTAVTAAGDAQVQAETAEGYMIRSEKAAKDAEDAAKRAEELGADLGGAAGAVGAHNVSTDAHGDIRQELAAVNARLTAFFDSDNQTLDELSEIVAYITSNKSLIDAITTSKVSVADIVNDLTTSVANKPLSAAQGAVLKNLHDLLENRLGQGLAGKLDATALPAAVEDALAQARESGEFDGAPGKTPVKGVDYFLPEEIEEVARQAAELVELPEGGGGGGWRKVYEYVWDANTEYQPLTLDFATGVMTFDKPPQLTGGYRLAPDLSRDSRSLNDAFSKIPNEYLEAQYQWAMSEVDGGYLFGNKTSIAEGGANANVDVTAFRFERPKTTPKFTGLDAKKVMVKSRGSGGTIYPYNYGWGFNIVLSSGKTVAGGSIADGGAHRAWEETTQVFAIDVNGVLSTFYEVCSLSPKSRTGSNQNFTRSKDAGLVNVYSLPDDVTITGLQYAAGSGNFGPANGTVIEVYVHD